MGLRSSQTRASCGRLIPLQPFVSYTHLKTTLIIAMPARPSLIATPTSVTICAEEPRDGNPPSRGTAFTRRRGNPDNPDNPQEDIPGSKDRKSQSHAWCTSSLNPAGQSPRSNLFPSRRHQYRG